jgi:putative ATP-dependent endonuclease of OLD family
MKLREVVIHNYRSIQDEQLFMSDYSLLIGMNNSGKSNVIDALRTFYEKDLEFKHARDFPKFTTADDESWMEAQYYLTEEETGTIKPEYLSDGSFCRIRKWFHPVDKVKLGLVAYEGGKLSGNMFYGWKNVGQAKLGRAIYIPAASRLEEHTKLTGPSALRDLVNDILKSIMKSSSAYANLSKQFDLFEGAIKAEQTADKRSLAGLEERINDEIAEWGAKFNLDITSPPAEDIIKSLIKHTILDSELNEPMESGWFGHGFQRHLIFSLIRISATYVSPDPPPKKKEFSPDLELLLFEEPESFLHPPQQNALDTNLRRLASAPGHQVLAATHSPVFVSCNTGAIADLLCLSKKNGKTGIHQIDDMQLKELFEDNLPTKDLLVKIGEQKDGQQLDPEIETELEAVRHFLWLNPERCGLFFARYVLIVEGLSEQVLINYLLKNREVDTSDKSVFVLDACGKFNVHRFMNLLGRLRIKHAVLHDLNLPAKTDKEKLKHEALNALISDAANEYTVEIKTLPVGLEDTLGLEIKCNDRWKASKILLKVQRNEVEVGKLQQFKDTVKDLLTEAKPIKN